MLSDKERELTKVVRKKVLERLEYDGETEDDFYEHKRRVIEAFEELLPEKSSFEL